MNIYIIKKIMIKLFYKYQFFYKHSATAYRMYLISKGCKIGKGTYFFDPGSNFIDTTRPYLIQIGEYCKITKGVIILSHDYSKSVLRLKYKDIIGEAGITKIGNNVFIGMNSIILRGIKVGDNVIIGAGSVVTHDLPDNVVAAGNPIKIIMSLDEHYYGRQQKTLKEAKEYAKEIYRVTGRKPTIKELDGFYPLFIKRDLNELKKNKLTIKFSADNYDDTVKYFMQSQPIYKSFQDFLEDCDIR